MTDSTPRISERAPIDRIERLRADHDRGEADYGHFDVSPDPVDDCDICWAISLLAKQEASLHRIATMAHLAWMDPPTVREIFQLIENAALGDASPSTHKETE